MQVTPDPRPEGRIRDRGLMQKLHLLWRECALCGDTGTLSLHHISKHPRDDMLGNLVMLCGSGTTGCHGLIEANNPMKLRELGEHVLKMRPDVIDYLYRRKGSEPAQEWMRRHFLLSDVGSPA